MGEPRGRQQSLRAWKGQDEDANLVRSLRRRRDLHAGIVQLGYVAVGFVLGFLLPMVQIGTTLEHGAAAPMLFGIAGGFISFVALVFSLLFLVVQYANTTVSPRLTLFRDDPMVWHAFGYFAMVFVYCTVAGLRTGIRGQQVTVVVPAVGIVLIVIALAISRAIQLRALRLLQFNAIMEEIRARGEEVVASLYRMPFVSDETAVGPGHADPDLPPAVLELRWQRPTTMLRQVDVPALLSEAVRLDAFIALRCRPGEEIRRGQVFAVVHATRPPADPHVFEAFSVGTDRAFAQDPLLAFRLLDDIANRAMSRTTNDPATGVQALGCVYDLIALVADRQLQLGMITDADGVPRIGLPFPTWEDFLTVGVDEIAYHGSEHPTVQARVRELLEDLVAITPPERHAALLARIP